MKKIDMRKVTRKKIEDSMTGATLGVGYDYIFEIDGVEMVAQYYCESRYELCPVKVEKDNPDADRISVYKIVDGMIFDTPDKIIHF